MNLLALAVGALSSFAFASASHAQQGQPFPAGVGLEDFAQTGAQSLDDLVGRTVLIEFFAHWCEPSRATIGRMNELQDRFGDLGLTVLGVTTAPRSTTDRYVAENGARYAYAFDASGSLHRALDVKNYPTAFLIDPTGTVTWSGNASALEDRVVVEHLDGAFRKPVWEWPKSTRNAVKALAKREYGKALALLDALDDPEVAEARDAVRGIVRLRMATLREAQASGDFLTVKRVAEQLLAELEELSDEQSLAREVQQSIERDPEARRVVRLQERLERLRTTRLGGSRDVERLIDRVEDLQREAQGTHAERQAQEFVRELRGRSR